MPPFMPMYYAAAPAQLGVNYPTQPETYAPPFAPAAPAASAANIEYPVMGLGTVRWVKTYHSTLEVSGARASKVSCQPVKVSNLNRYDSDLV
jgi:hypothetical protein